jgi:hypothetical protein
MIARKIEIKYKIIKYIDCFDSFDLKNTSVPGNNYLDCYIFDTNSKALPKYLELMGGNTDILNIILNKYKKISIICNVFVEKYNRNKGIGKELVENAIYECCTQNVNCIFLAANVNNLEPNLNLENWYNSIGFITICNTKINPVMMFEITENNIAFV